LINPNPLSTRNVRIVPVITTPKPISISSCVLYPLTTRVARRDVLSIDCFWSNTQRPGTSGIGAPSKTRQAAITADRRLRLEHHAERNDDAEERVKSHGTPTDRPWVIAPPPSAPPLSR
jgi:hypothetical protein